MNLDNRQDNTYSSGHENDASVDQSSSYKKYDSTIKNLTRRTFVAGMLGVGVLGLSKYVLKTKNHRSRFDGPGKNSALYKLQNSGVSTKSSERSSQDLRKKLGLDIPAPVEDRILVLIELAGGNDGPSMVVPYGDGKYYDLRPKLAVKENEVIPVDNQVGLHSELKDLSKRQFGIVEGIGNVSGSYSHFTNQDFWHRAGGTGASSGFIAKIADDLVENHGSQGLVALSVNGYAPQFSGINARSLMVYRANEVNNINRTDYIFPAFKNAVASFSGGPMTSTINESWNTIFSATKGLSGNVSKINEDDPMIKEGKSLGRQLWAASDFLSADLGIRVVHAQMTGFDTHQGHAYKYPELMKQLNYALDGFFKKIEKAGMKDRVLVALTSEFGRRAKENNQGFDHGNGSSLMVFGPVNPGRHGVYNPFSQLESSGSLKTEVPLYTYLRTLANDWLGCESVLPGSESFTGLI